MIHDSMQESNCGDNMKELLFLEFPAYNIGKQAYTDMVKEHDKKPVYYD